LKDTFSLKEVEILVDRIEKHNKPIISESEVELARKIVSEARTSGKVTSNWLLPDGEESQIPVRSLQLAIDELKVSEVKNKSVNVKIAAAETNFDSEIILSDEWYMKPDSERYATSKSFNTGIKLMPHQVKGYAWLHGLATDERIPEIISGRGGLLADDMGLGKTIQVIRLIESIRTEFEKSEKPVLIVGPVSLLKTSWEHDGIKKFFNEDFLKKNDVIHMSDVPKVIPKEVILKEVLSFESEINKNPGTQFNNLHLSEEITIYLNSIKSMIGNSIVLCSYETLRSRIFELASLDFALFVIDEAQKIKNVSTGQSAAAKAIKADIRVAMTGTPIENSISDLWNICDFVSKGFLGSLKEFNEKYTSLFYLFHLNLLHLICLD
jgi:SNF2 family DNA or RNA helicase